MCRKRSVWIVFHKSKTVVKLFCSLRSLSPTHAKKTCFERFSQPPTLHLSHFWISRICTLFLFAISHQVPTGFQLFFTLSAIELSFCLLILSASVPFCFSGISSLFPPFICKRLMAYICRSWTWLWRTWRSSPSTAWWPPFSAPATEGNPHLLWVFNVHCSIYLGDFLNFKNLSASEVSIFKLKINIFFPSARFQKKNSVYNPNKTKFSLQSLFTFSKITPFFSDFFI